MNNKNKFYDTIFEYYNQIFNGKISNNLLTEMSDGLADYYYDQYNRFSIQYPKSVKRYSSFQLKDLDHPTTFEIIIKFFKEKFANNYPENVKLILNMTENELKAFEKSRDDFSNMF